MITEVHACTCGGQQYHISITPIMNGILIIVCKLTFACAKTPLFPGREGVSARMHGRRSALQYPH